MNSKTTAYVVLGLKEGKPRAASVAPADLEVAAKAAASMGLKIGRTDTPEGLSLTAKLPKARIFATGKGLVPLAKAELYERLSKVLTTINLDSSSPQPAEKAGDDPKAGPTTDPKSPMANSFDPWSAIEVGGTVLFRSDPKEGWFECQVIGISKDGKKLKVKWRDYPTFKAFEIPRHSAGLIAKVK